MISRHQASVAAAMAIVAPQSGLPLLMLMVLLSAVAAASTPLVKSAQRRENLCSGEKASEDDSEENVFLMS